MIFRDRDIVTTIPDIGVLLKNNTDLCFHFFSLQGFPSSVTPDYVPFQIWDSLQVIVILNYLNDQEVYSI